MFSAAVELLAIFSALVDCFFLWPLFATFYVFSFWRGFSLWLRLLSSSDDSLSYVDAERADSDLECADGSQCINFSMYKIDESTALAAPHCFRALISGESLRFCNL